MKFETYLIIFKIDFTHFYYSLCKKKTIKYYSLFHFQKHLGVVKVIPIVATRRT